MPSSVHILQDYDLALAAELQAALLPGTCPADCEHQSAAARNRMCGLVGGDFYDFFRINDDQVALVIGDVVGHGVRASLLMAQIMGWLRGEVERRSRPSEVITDLNLMLVDLGNRVGQIMICSLFYAVIDMPTGISFFVNAGHPRPLLFDSSDGQIMPLGGQNILLGVEPFCPVEGCHTFLAGQRLVLFTDGLTDASNATGQNFGDDRLLDLVHQTRPLTPAGAADEIFRRIQLFRGNGPQTDDETLVIVDRL